MVLFVPLALMSFSPPPQNDLRSRCSSSSQPLITRRALLIPSAASAAAFTIPPLRAAMADGNFILTNPFDNEFLKLRNAQLELDSLSRQFAKASYQQNDDDRAMVFQLLGFQFKPTSKLMDKMIQPYGLMYDLTDEDRAKGQELSKRFGEGVLALEDRNRARAPVSEQLVAINGLSGLVDRYLEVAATKYDVPSKATAERPY